MAEYCYHCAYYHAEPVSSGNYSAEGCSDYGEISPMLVLTKPQRQSLKKVWLRTHEFGYIGGLPYREFRRQVQPGPGCVMINFAGMVLGIEKCGHTHS